MRCLAFLMLIIICEIAGTVLNTHELVIATGANSEYFKSLRNLVGSIAFWCPQCRVAVFNLGLTSVELLEIKTWCRTSLHWGRVVVHKDPKTYAFKAEAIREGLKLFGAVLWLDSGSSVTGPIFDAIAPLLYSDGYFLVRGQDVDMVPWVHPGMLKHFGVEASAFKGNYSYSGNTVGFVKKSPVARHIIPLWLECSRNVSCIAPVGSSKVNHRFDQAALSVIIYSSALSIKPHTELLAATRPASCLKPAPKVVWTSRRSESCYQKFSVC